MAYTHQGGNLFKVHYKFGPNKSFTYSTTNGPVRGKVEVSLTSEPITKSMFTNSASTTNIANMPNIIGGSNEFSINDVFGFDSMTDLRRDLTGNVTSTPINGIFVYRGAFKQQLSGTCSGLTMDNGTTEFECRRTCFFFEYRIHEDSSKCLSKDCLSYWGSYLFRDSLTSRVCIAGCGGDYSARDGNVCKQKCDSYILDEGPISPSDTAFTCTSTCSGFEFSHPSFTYADGSLRIYCRNTCDYGSYTNFYNDGTRKCTDVCANHPGSSNTPSTLIYLNNTECVAECPGSAEFIGTVANFNAANEYGTCQASCDAPSFQLETPEFVYPSTATKKYCLSACNQGQYKSYYIDGLTQHCVSDCRSEVSTNTIPPLTRYRTAQGAVNLCSQACASGKVAEIREFNTAMEDGLCVANCPGSTVLLTIDEFKFPDASPKAYCLVDSTISSFDKNYIEDGTIKSTDSCLYEQASVPIPPNLRYEKTEGYKTFCLSKCVGFISETNNFDSLLESGVCETECIGNTLTSHSLLWEDSSQKTYCVSSCTALTSTYSYATLDNRCVSNCQAEGYSYTLEDNKCSNDCSDLVLDNIYCVSECPAWFPLIEDNKCTDKCSSVNPFIVDGKYCSSSCPNLKYEDLCVDSCQNDQIIQISASQDRIYTSKPFISSDRRCSESCEDQAFPFINSQTNECVSSCPPKCQGDSCFYNNLVYIDGDGYCRASCKESDFPLTDNTLMSCLSECTFERPFISNGECLPDCPANMAFVTRKPTCGGEICDSECSLFSQICSDQCPLDFPLTLVQDNISYCVCKCPSFYNANGNKCVLFCDPELGLIPDEPQSSCIHCFRDKNESFFFEGACVEACPPGTAPNKHSVCTPCAILGLWTNEEQQCIPFILCNELSHFDYANLICTLCEGKGLMIVCRGDKLSCELTDCSDTERERGYISDQSGQRICIFCKDSEFFEDPRCKGICLYETSYEFHSRKCLKCKNGCFCCKNGKCRGKSCHCSPGWEGKYCSIPSTNSFETSQSILDFMDKRTSSSGLQSNENELIFQLALLYSNQRRQLTLNTPNIEGFISNVLKLINRQYIKYAFQPSLLETLDNLLQLTVSHAKVKQKTEERDHLVAFLYEITNDIQIFNTTKSIIPSFEAIFEGKYQGIGFNFYFGTDIAKEKRISLNKCLKRMKINLNLPENHKFPYRLLILKESLKEVKTEENVFVASTSPFKVMFSLYTQKGVLNIGKECEERFVDVSYEIPLENSHLIAEVNQKSKTRVNLFDNQDPFFNDRCVPFSDENDITLQQRKQRFFLDPASVCKESPMQVCSVENVDQDGNAACFCKGIQNRKKSVLKADFLSYPKSNYILIICLSVFKESRLTRNIGFYTVFLPCFLVMFLICYFNRKIDFDLSGENRFNYMRNDILMFDPDSMDKEVYFEECSNLKATLDTLIIQEHGYISGYSSNFDFSSLPTLPDLSLLRLEDKLKLDKRPLKQYAFDIFSQENTFFYTFFAKSTVDPKSFVLLLFITELNLNIAMNCFFIDDDIVDDLNESNNTSIFRSLSNELLKTIWATITAKFLTWLLYLFYSFKEKESNLLKKRLILTKDDSAVKAYNLFLADHSYRLLSVTFGITAFNLFCLYFVVIYNEIYTQSTSIWLNGIFMGLFMDIVVVQGIVPALLVLSRALATKYKRLEILFKIASNLSILKNLSIFE